MVCLHRDFEDVEETLDKQNTIALFIFQLFNAKFDWYMRRETKSVGS